MSDLMNGGKIMAENLIDRLRNMSPKKWPPTGIYKECLDLVCNCEHISLERARDLYGLLDIKGWIDKIKNLEVKYKFRINRPGDEEVISVRLDKNKYPIAFHNRVMSLVNSGLDHETAEREAESEEIVLELYYDPDRGLFAVESEAVECTTIYNPYSGDKMESYEDEV